MGQQVARRVINNNSRGNSYNLDNDRRRRNILFDCLLRNRNEHCDRPSPLQNFVDLHLLPPELGLEILKNLNATDLCLASCVWSDLANDESLWEGLCMASWGFCSGYQTWKRQRKSFKRLFLLLDEGSLTFNSQPQWGIQYLIDNEVLEDNCEDIAKFFNETNQLCWHKVRVYLRERQDVLEEVIKLQDFKNQFLPNALRKFFHLVDSPTSRGDYLHQILEKFAIRFAADNPDFSLPADVIMIVCYSLILLSVDLSSPHVKNKMSKREFIKNVCRAIQQDNPNLQADNGGQQAVIDREFAGHLYDNIYLVGHVAPQRWSEDQRN